MRNVTRKRGIERKLQKITPRTGKWTMVIDGVNNERIENIK